MTALSLVKTRIQGGVWEGVLTGVPGSAAPDLIVTHLGQPVGNAAVAPDPAGAGTYSVRVAIPPDLLSDGVQTFLIADAADGETLDAFTIVTGEPLEDDIRGELDLLRAELDLLKRAFRRHCVETM